MRYSVADSFHEGRVTIGATFRDKRDGWTGKVFSAYSPDGDMGEVGLEAAAGARRDSRYPNWGEFFANFEPHESKG